MGCASCNSSTCDGGCNANALCSFCQQPSPCGCEQHFTQLQGSEIGRTLVATLTPCVDQIRNIFTVLGARPYHVSLIHTQWSSGMRGGGVEQVIRKVDVLPTPLIADLNDIQKELMSIGTEEVGVLKVSEISPRFTEDQLTGISDNGEPVPEDQQFYWEIFFPRPNGPGVRRRFTVRGTPNYDALNFQWTVILIKQYEDRDRQGNPQ